LPNDLAAASPVVVAWRRLDRAGICALLASVAGVHVAGAAANGHAALFMVNEPRPDVVLTDICLPNA
jgi:YesN/AraC family two-component response regulator